MIKLSQDRQQGDYILVRMMLSKKLSNRSKISNHIRIKNW